MRAPLLLSLLVLASAAVLAQEAPGPDPDQEEAVTIAGIDSRLATLEALELEEAEKEAVRKVYQQAKDLVGKANAADPRRASFVQATVEAPALLERVRADLAKPKPALEEQVPSKLDPADLAQALDTAENELKAQRELLDTLRTESQRRTARRSELTEQLSQAESRLREAQEALLGPAPDSLGAQLAAARRVLLRAQLQEARADRDALLAEQESYRARAELLPARSDLARQRAAHLGELVETLRKRLADARRAEADRATAEARALRLDAAVQLVPSLRALADENESLARERSAEDGLAQRVEAAGNTLATTQKQLSQLRERFFTVRRKIDAAGLTNAMARLLRMEYEALPDVDEIDRRRSAFSEQLSDVQLRQIQLEETRESAVEIEQAIAQILADPALATHGVDPNDVEAAARKILESRLETVKALLRDYQTYLERLVEIGLAERKLASAAIGYRAYIEERILWVRSVTGSTLPNPVQAAEGAGWLFSPRLMQVALGRASNHAWNYPLVGFGKLLLLLLSLAAAGYAWRTWGRGSGISFARTVWMLWWTFALAAPPGLVLYLLGDFLASPPDQIEWGVALGQSFRAAGQVLLGATVLWCLGSRRGLAAQQFHWNAEALTYLRRQLVWFVPLVIPCVVVSVALDQQENVAYSESLGRITFVVAELALALIAQRLLRRDSPVFSTKGQTTSLVARLRGLWLVLLVGAPIGFAVLALWGYYYTALRLTRSLEISLFFGGSLILLRALILRWFLIARRRLAREQAQRRSSLLKPSEEEAGGESAPPPESLPEEQLDLTAIKEQIDKLIRSGIVVAAGLGLLWIWADALPALKRLDQVQLYPSLEILSAPDAVLPEILAAPPAPAAEEGAAPSNGSGPLSTSQPSLAKAVTNGAGSGWRVTLGDLLLALLLIALTTVASRNLPGLLEIALLQHLPVDAGARYAVITIARYLIVIVGVWMAAGAIGVTWSSIQWLAAALTFGLAFGLQEIFANFVSGLIIFAERPVNVGDVVTVGTVTGKVTRIRIRAITIQDWDRKELIVPNREFVTGQIVNWTLTDHVLRIVVPVGVAYGTDAKRVTDLLMKVARAEPKVLSDPPPLALFVGFGNSSLDFELRAFITGIDNLFPTRDALLKGVQQALADEGIEVPFPQRDLHIRSADRLAQALREARPEGLPEGAR